MARTGIRRPHTQQERRLAVSMEDEPRIRAKRNARNLPTAWDDQWIPLRRTWKAWRRAQHRTAVEL